MPPKPCPNRLKRLIADEPHTLKLILHALRDRRQNKGAETFPIQSMSQVTLDFTDYSVTVRSELALALKEIDLPADLDLIHECPICHDLFWAGRIDKEACDKHAEQWRKSRQRRKEKAIAAIQAAERADAQLRKELQSLSPTAVALLNAIVIGGEKVFYKIDEAAWRELKNHPAVRRVPPFRIVHRTLTMMVNRGYLRHNPHRDDFHKDYYFPEQHLVEAWTEIRR
jgi:hypothetical protein